MSNNKEILGLHRITKVRLKELCKKHRLYQTPHLNDQLYLHYQGFQAIENLEEYTGLKCLWLESNAISEIQGLDCLKELKCLFLQNNLIRKIENLEGCSELDTLNLASNHISKIENCGVDVLPVLSSLNLSRNYIRCSQGLKELVNCKSLWSLDLSHNRIDDILIVKIFGSMPELRVLVLQGNPVVHRVPQYRKTLILECKNLTYLDTRPVFPKDRACAEAWKRGGYEEERREHERWIRRERRKIRDSVNATLRLRIKHGDKEVQLITSTDEEDDEEDERGELKMIKSSQDTSTDLEIKGVEHIVKTQDALEIKREKDEENSDSSPSTLDDGTSVQSVVLDTHEPSGQQQQPEQDERVSDEEDVQVVSEKPAGEQQMDVQVLPEEPVNEQQNAEEPQLQIENSNVCEEGLKEDELVVQHPAPAVIMKTASTFSEFPTANINTGTSSSSSELSSDSESSSMDYDTNEEEGDDEDDSRMNEFEPKEKPMVCDVEMEEETENHNQTIESRSQEAEEDKDEAKKLESNPEHSNSMSFDELAESQSISYAETLNVERSTQATNNAMRPYKIETMNSSDEEDSGLFNSFQTASSFSEVENHDVATPTSETPTNLDEVPPESPSPNDESLVHKEPSINPDDINIPDNLEVDSWLKTFLTGLKTEQERVSSDSSSLTESSLEEFSVSDSSDAGGDENKSEKLNAGEREKDSSEKIGIQDLLDKIFDGISLGDENLGDGVKGEDLEATVPSVNDYSEKNETGAPDPDQKKEGEAMSWWERTLAAALSITSPAPPQQSDESTRNEEDFEESPQASEESTQSKGLSQQEEAEATALLDSILTGTQRKMDEGTTTQDQVEATELLSSISSEIQQKTERTAVQKEQESTDDEVSDDDSHDELPSSSHTTTLRECLESFNKAIEIINKRREERLQQIDDFVNHPLTKENATETREQLDQQIEKIKEKKHERVRQLVEHVYAQRDKYDDTLEVIDGRLMVVKRGTGALEEVQPPPSLFSSAVADDSMSGETQTTSRYVSCGVSTNSVVEVSATQVVMKKPPLSSSGSDSDEYGTALSDEEVEQHQSDTKIRKIISSSMETCITMDDQDEVSFEKHFIEEQEESRQRVLQIHDNIDANICTEVRKWIDEGSEIPSVSPAVQKQMGREEIALLKQMMAEEAVEGALDEDEGGDLPSVSSAVKKRMSSEEIALLKPLKVEEGVEGALDEDGVLEEDEGGDLTSVSSAIKKQIGSEEIALLKPLKAEEGVEGALDEDGVLEEDEGGDLPSVSSAVKKQIGSEEIAVLKPLKAEDGVEDALDEDGLLEEDEGGDLTSVSSAVKKQMGSEEIALLEPLKAEDGVEGTLDEDGVLEEDESGDLPSVSSAIKKQIGSEEIALLKPLKAEDGVQDALDEDDVLEEDEGGDLPSVSSAVKKQMGSEEIALLEPLKAEDGVEGTLDEDGVLEEDESGDLPSVSSAVKKQVDSEKIALLEPLKAEEDVEGALHEDGLLEEDEGDDLASVSSAVKKQMGSEEIVLLEPLKAEEDVEGALHEDGVLEDVASIFEIPDDDD